MIVKIHLVSGKIMEVEDKKSKNINEFIKNNFENDNGKADWFVDKNKKLSIAIRNIELLEEEQ